MAKGYAALLLTFVHCCEINRSLRIERGTKRSVVRYRLPYVGVTTRTTSKFLPSSSSSEVIDLERIERAVVGALLGGGGAEGERERETEAIFQLDNG